jgi:hypothetical protein
LLYYAKDDMSGFDRLQPWLQEKIKSQIVFAPKSATAPELGDNPPDFESPEITDADIPF